MLVLMLQMLPVKQAIRYFFVDNIMVEEILHVNKSATKNFRFLDEDHNFIFDMDNLQPHFTMAERIPSMHFSEMLPASLAADVHTPPPNRIAA